MDLNKVAIIWTDGMKEDEKKVFMKDLEIAATHPVIKRLFRD